jgi:choline dehydrogenase-like flavoprotein
VIEHDVDVVIVGSGAGGGTVAHALRHLPREGVRVLVLEQGPRLMPSDFTGRELEMAAAIFEDGGGVLTADGAMTLAYGRVYGGSTVAYTGTSLMLPERVTTRWNVPGITHDDIVRRATIYAGQNNVHLLDDDDINENNHLFVEGCKAIGCHAEQFPLNLKGCRGSGLCNLGCPNLAKQGTHRVQLPAAEQAGVEVVTRAEVRRIGDRSLDVHVSAAPPGAKGAPSEWAPGEHRVRARCVIVAGGSIGSTALLLRSGFAARVPQLGERYTCHPAHILVAEHARPIVNDVGHPKSFYLDRFDEGFILETCMYFPFITAKNMTGFGAEHSALMNAFPRLQMILVLAHDKAVPGNRIAVDASGKAVVHYTFTPEVIHALTAATRLSAAIFFGAGAVRVHAPSADPPLIERRDADRIDDLISDRHFFTHRISVSAAHLMGGCGMGRTAGDSVTDSFGRVHGVPWLRVADSALFPDSSEVNPYLTVMALADRAAEGVLADLPALRAAAGAAA